MKKKLAVYAIPDINPDYSEYIHDHNLCVFQNGKIEKYLQLERITGQKYDNSLHKRLYALLKEAKLLTEDLQIGFVDSVIGRSMITSDGKIRFEANPFSQLSPQPEKASGFWLDHKIETLAIRHELAHIFSAVPFWGMFKDRSLLVHFDGGASVGNFSVWTFDRGELKLVDYGWKLKYLSSLFNANALNFFILGVKRKEHNSLPGKFMGYAGWGQYDTQIEQWLVENDFFQDIWQDKKRFFHEAEEKFGWKAKHFNPKDKFLQNIAATVQAYFTRNLLLFFKELKRAFGYENLYYTGGSALNLYVNSELWRQKIFRNVFIPPATGDSGLSIGAGAYMEWLDGNGVKRHLPYLNNWNLNCTQVIDRQQDIPVIAQFLLEKKIIAVCNGFGEAGPRALGNRSIIALPDSKSLAKVISVQKKGREWYRPIAPVMLKQVAQQVTGLDELPGISRYMLVNFKILPVFRKQLAGVVHIDGTSRIQVLFERRENPFLWDLLEYMYKNYGVLGLVNTSFNAKGKPIVHYQAQAIEQAQQMQLDGLVINGYFERLK